jgi:hypothetical protein
MASWRADTVLECTAVSFMIYDILHRSIVVQLDSFALGVGAKVCIISLSLSLHIAMYMYPSLSTLGVCRVALPRYTPPKPAHQSDQ